MSDIDRGWYAQHAPLNPGECETARKELVHFLMKQGGAQYYMLVSNEAHHYTVFQLQSTTTLDYASTSIIDLVKEIGILRGVEQNPDNTVFWITGFDEQTHPYLLFPYDSGVIKI